MRAKLCKRDGDGGGLSLPEDIILEVLLRLPAKALCRFRCVSTSWRALISDPAFVAALRSRATGPLIVAQFGHQLRLLDKGGNVLMVFDVRGGRTAALAPTRLDRIFVDRAELGAMIINPASGRNITIAGTNNPPPPSWMTNSPAMMSEYSFGRAAASGDYKVLRLATCVGPNNRWCQVATVMDGSAETTWRQRPWCPFYDASFTFGEKATVNAVVYFLVHNAYSESHDRREIVAFDLESEEWKPEKIKGPLLGHKSKHDKWSITLTELKGNLCMVHNVNSLADHCVAHYADIWLLKDSDLVGHYADIWLLEDPTSCVWVKAYKIEMPEKRSLLFTKPLDVLTDGTMLLLNMFQRTGNKICPRYILQIYNPSTKAFTDFMEMAEGFNGRMTFYTGGLQS